jgi:hypothetical protein
LFGLFALALMNGSASARVDIHINKATQQMTVSVDGATRYNFAVSTGRGQFSTPTGSFRPQWLARSHFSRKYYMSPMPYSIFFHKGYAIHGTNYIRQLGGPASHGCIRLHPANAAALFALVQREGMGNTRIVISGAHPNQWAAGPSRIKVKKKRYSRQKAPRSPSASTMEPMPTQQWQPGPDWAVRSGAI